MFTLPTALTWARILLIPLFVGVFFLPDQTLIMPDKNLIATVVFVVAAITDWLDGYLARRLGQTSPFGAFLDPVADKLIVAVALVMLVQTHASVWFAVPAMVIVSREITVSALREWMSKIGSPGAVAVSFAGKIKTWAQMIAVVVLLVAEPGGTGLVLLGYFAIYVAAVLTILTMIGYLRQALPHLNDHSDK